jgi:hypothetical protein
MISISQLVLNGFIICRFGVAMDELLLPLTFNGEDLELPVKLYAYGHTFRVEVLVGETAVIFESDEEGSYRALVDVRQMEKQKLLSRGLLQAVAEALEKLR